jgi:hypothetical protein
MTPVASRDISGEVLPMLVASLFFSCVLVLITYLSARRSGRFGGACALAAAGMVFGCPLIFFPALALCGLLIVLVGLVCRLTGKGTGLFLKGSLAALVASHLFVGISSFEEVREQQRLREQYPAQSLAARLTYETRHAQKAADLPQELPRIQSPTVAASPIEKDLQMVEEGMEESLQGRSRMRNFSLQLLHQETLTDFINSPGFGVTRSIRPRKAFVELPEAGPIPFGSPASSPQKSVPNGETPPSGVSSSPGEETVHAPPKDALQRMHRDGLLDFVNPEGFGYVKDREHVIGFQAHQFRTMPQLPDAGMDNQRWRVATVELISILKRDEPVAYRSEYLPRMEELRDAPTRPLNTFEQQALADLRRGQDIEVGTTPDRIRLLGSIRAVKHCLSCHEVRRGQLLGAFSYTLFRDPARP